MIIQFKEKILARERQEASQEKRMDVAADYRADTVYFRCVGCGQHMFDRRGSERFLKKLCADCEMIIKVKLDQAETALAFDGDPNLVAVTRGTQPVTQTIIRRMLPGEENKA